METHTNLPAIVNLYLELINQLLSMASDYDSNSGEYNRLSFQVDHYFTKIQAEMLKQQELSDKDEL